MTVIALLITAITLAIADHLTGTAFYQKGNTMDDYMDWSDEDHGGTSDFWAAYLASFEDDLGVTGNLPLGLVAGDDDLVHFRILSDDELAEIDDEVDDWPDEDVCESNADWLWFLSGGDSADADYDPEVSL